MTPSIALLVRSSSGAASALAAVALRRAQELGLKLEIAPVVKAEAPGIANGPESITAVVPVEFASTQHEAWCLLCQISLLRREVDVAILVLGAGSAAGFRARQRALIAAAGKSRPLRKPIVRRRAA